MVDLFDVKDALDAKGFETSSDNSILENGKFSVEKDGERVAEVEIADYSDGQGVNFRIVDKNGEVEAVNTDEPQPVVEKVVNKA